MIEEEDSVIVKSLKNMYDIGDQVAKMLTNSCYYAPHTVISCKWYLDDINIDDSDGSCTMKYIAHGDYTYTRFVDLDRMLDPEYVQAELQSVREKTDQYKAKMDEARQSKTERIAAETKSRELREYQRLQAKYGDIK